MFSGHPERIINLVMACAFFFVLLQAIKLLHSKKHFLTIVFFVFAISCGLLSTLYWGVYEFLRPETRMPFAANELCEWALFLLYASSLRAVFPKSASFEKKIIPVALFAAANVVLWIAWSGEWVQDILTGLSMGWCLCVITSCLCLTCALSTAEWVGAGTVSFLLILGQSLTFFTPEPVSGALDKGCSTLLLVAMLWLILKTVWTLKKEKQVQKGLSLSYAAFAWGAVFMYMSGGTAYMIASMLTVSCYFLMLWAIKEEVAEG